jgi:hypothetical protein
VTQTRNRDAVPDRIHANARAPLILAEGWQDVKPVNIGR